MHSKVSPDNQLIKQNRRCLQLNLIMCFRSWTPNTAVVQKPSVMLPKYFNWNVLFYCLQLCYIILRILLVWSIVVHPINEQTQPNRNWTSKQWFTLFTHCFIYPAICNKFQWAITATLFTINIQFYRCTLLSCTPHKLISFTTSKMEKWRQTIPSVTYWVKHKISERIRQDNAASIALPLFLLLQIWYPR